MSLLKITPFKSLSPFGGGGESEGYVNSNYVEFDGISKHLSPTSTVTLTDEFTISCWVNMASFTNGYVFSNIATSDYFRIVNSTLLWFRIAGTTATFTLPTLLIGTWYHVLLVRESDDSIDLYINNSLQYSGSESADVTISLIGKYGSSYIAASIDEIAFFNTDISAADRATLYGSGTPQGCGDASLITGCTAYWKMGDGDTFPTLSDSVGTNHATMNNMVEGDIKSY